MPSSSSSWQLTLLGPPRLVDGRGNVVRCEGKVLALLAYLALEGAAPRSRVAGLLWPDTVEGSARNNLVHLLRRTAKGYEADLVQAGETLSLAEFVQVDVHGERGPGELLEGATWPDLPEFTDWLLAWRGRLDSERTSAWRAQAQALEDDGSYDEALSVTRRLREVDSLSEDALRREMRLLYLLGNAAEALGVYEAAATALHETLGTQPLPETRQLARDIGRSAEVRASASGETPLPVSVARPPTLVGRADAWAKMEAAWANGQGIVLTGEPGVGKTRLALDFLGAHGGGMRFEGRPGDAGLLYATHARTYRQVLDAYPDLALEPWVRDELTRILPYLGGHPAPIENEEQKLRFWQAKVESLGAAIARGLRYLVFDDVQFMDVASVEAGGFVFANLGWGRPDAPYRTIHIFRKGELDETKAAMLEMMVAAQLVVLVDVDPLGSDAVEELVRQLDLPGGGQVARELGQFTGGNPLLLLETARSLHETHARTGELPDVLPLPDKATTVIASRLARLSPSALHAARAAAVLESDFDLEIVAQTLGAPLLDTASAWEELERAHIVRGSRFEHDLVAEAVRRGLPSAVRRLLHRSAARTLAGLGAQPGRVARHWREGGDARSAAPWFVKAGQEAVRAFREREADTYFREAQRAFEEAGLVDEAARLRA
ncbi:BTAD domain-containing putative transcriptional regulator [Deinococcus yavapaiensis]|uniref:DNA-binding SARP family transcriptional activator n=1 Tax=Deinococcus yavapaiensis KR-236 TaxID=694435 RepID=A0A318SE83_9DEIO|nr:BTAD domain-containing putative transcriptional regulator [Deinococcus yavapaiensis]PYE55401.1 DNA-binding SARP family transcriptional activator [Deinococcus yavapaiensis KR-236]